VCRFPNSELCGSETKNIITVISFSINTVTCFVSPHFIDVTTYEQLHKNDIFIVNIAVELDGGASGELSCEDTAHISALRFLRLGKICTGRAALRHWR
jgi:hypothetical protein